MERAQKRESVEELLNAFSASGAIVVAQNAGLKVAEMTDLRVQVKKAGGHLKVAKNRLAKLALKQTDMADISDLFKGPTILAYSEDPTVAPKIATKFAEKNQRFVVLGGVMGKAGLDAEGVKAVANLPSLDGMRSILIGLINQPATRIAAVVQAPGAQIARVLSAYAEKDAA